MRRMTNLIIWAGVFLLMVSLFGKALGEGWIMCQPDSYVNIRETPGNRGAVIGYLELGDSVETDGQNRNGYTHIIHASTESGEGWVASGYLVQDRPQIETVTAWVDAAGRVACRRAIGGNRRKWLHHGDQLTLYASSAEWSITSEGFIRTEYVLAER